MESCKATKTTEKASSQFGTNFHQLSAVNHEPYALIPKVYNF